MSRDQVMEVLRELVWTATLTAGPVLLGGLVVGLVMGILQSATQIQETSLTFIPKLVVVGLAVVVGGPWAVDKMVTFTSARLAQVGTLAPRGPG